MKFLKLTYFLPLLLTLFGASNLFALTLEEVTREMLISSVEEIISAFIFNVDANVIIVVNQSVDKIHAVHTIAKLIDKEVIVKINPVIIRTLLREDKGLAKELAKLIDKETIIRIYSEVIRTFLDADKALVSEFAKLIDKETIVKIDGGVIGMLVQADVSLASEFAKLIDKETISKVDLTVIRSLVNADRSLVHVFFSYFNLNDNNWFKSNYDLIYFFAFCGDDTITEKILKKIEQRLSFIDYKNHTSVESGLFVPEIVKHLNLLKQLRSKLDIKFKKSTLQSIQHFDFVFGYQSYLDVLGALNDRLNDNDRHMLLKLLHKSRQEEKNGNFTFIHAQVRSFLPLSEFIKKAAELHDNNGIPYVGHYPLRFVMQGGKFALDDQKIEKFRQEGLCGDKEEGVYTLCMNAFLFGSAQISGSYSLDYWLRNHDQSSNKNLDFTARKMLEAYGFEKYYDRYKNEFDSLWDDVMKDGQRGNLLLLSLTPEQVKKWVYPSNGNRNKNYVDIDGQASDDVGKFLTTLTNNPQNLVFKELRDTHYCLVLSDKAMDPVNGVKIYPFTSDESYVRAWREKLDLLFAKIKHDVELDKKSVQLKVQLQVTQNKTLGTIDPLVNRRLAILGKQMQGIHLK